MGAVVLDPSRRVLLVRRGQEPQRGEWSLPGGAVELGERLEEAVCREVLEETGLTVDAVAVIEVLDRIVWDAAGQVQYHYVLVDYLCRVRAGTLCCASDAMEACWMSEDDAAKRAAGMGLQDLAVGVIRKALAWRGVLP